MLPVHSELIIISFYSYWIILRILLYLRSGVLDLDLLNSLAVSLESRSSTSTYNNSQSSPTKE